MDIQRNLKFTTEHVRTEPRTSPLVKFEGTELIENFRIFLTVLFFIGYFAALLFSCITYNPMFWSLVKVGVICGLVGFIAFHSNKSVILKTNNK